MDDVKKLKAMLAGLGKSQLLWERQIQEFERLQSQVSTLQRRAGSDPVASQKLIKLNEYMNREGNDAQHQIVEKVAIAGKSFKELGEQLRALTNAQQGGMGNELPTPLSKVVKNNSRNFA